MKVITKYLKVYIKFWKVAGLILHTYRVDAYMLIVSVILLSSVYIIFFSAIFSKTKYLGGWQLNEALLLVGVYTVNWGILKLFYAKGMENTIDYIFNSTFDFKLLKPINERFLAYMLPPTFKEIVPIIILTVYCFSMYVKLNLEFSILKITLFLLLLIFGQIVCFSTLQFAVSLTFFTNKSEDLFGIFEEMWSYSRFPMDIFQSNIKFIFSYFIPISLFAYYPTAILIGKLPINVSSIFIPIFMGTFLVILSQIHYKIGLKNYSGGG